MSAFDIIDTIVLLGMFIAGLVAFLVGVRREVLRRKTSSTRHPRGRNNVHFYANQGGEFRVLPPGACRVRRTGPRVRK